MKRLGIILITAGAVLCTGACAGVEPEGIAALDKRIADIRGELDKTRTLVREELDRLSKDIALKLDELEESILTELDEAVCRAEDNILEGTMGLRKTIRYISTKSDADIALWGQRMNAMTERAAIVFTQSMERMQEESYAAIARGDVDLQQRISLAQGKTRWMQENLSSLTSRADKTISSLDGIEQRFTSLNSQLPLFQKRMGDMQSLLEQYEASLQTLIGERLKDYQCSDLGGISNKLYETYFQLEAMHDEVVSMAGEIEDGFSSIPDIEGALSEAEDLVDEMDEMEDLVDSFDMGYIQEILSELEEAYSYALSGYDELDEIESRFEFLEDFMSDLELDSDSCADRLNQLIQACEDTISEMEGWVSDLD